MTASDDTQPISLILICYKHEKFVAEAIDGVLSQTYSPLEILIIDDCSPDRTAQVIADKLAVHPDGSKVGFIRNARNIGGKRSIELGLSRTKGDFVVIASGDDVMLPEMIAEMAGVRISYGVSLVTANAVYIDAESKPLGRTHRDPGRRGDDSFETLARDGSNVCCFGAAMGFEREIFSKFGWPPLYLGAFDIMLPYYAYLLKGARFIAKPLLKYRVHSNNTSLSLLEERQDETQRLLMRERSFYQHLAHALLMQEVLMRLAGEQPREYSEIERRIGPLLMIQIVEMAKKLVNTRIELARTGASLDIDHFGVLPKPAAAEQAPG